MTDRTKHYLMLPIIIPLALIEVVVLFPVYLLMDVLLSGDRRGGDENGLG